VILCDPKHQIPTLDVLSNHEQEILRHDFLNLKLDKNNPFFKEGPSKQLLHPFFKDLFLLDEKKVTFKVFSPKKIPLPQKRKNFATNQSQIQKKGGFNSELGLS
jgi:hypothetical protein